MKWWQYVLLNPYIMRTRMPQYIWITVCGLSISHFLPGLSGHRWGGRTVAEGQHGHHQVLSRDRYTASQSHIPHILNTIVQTKRHTWVWPATNPLASFFLYLQRSWRQQLERPTVATLCPLSLDSTPPTGSPAREGESATSRTNRNSPLVTTRVFFYVVPYCSILLFKFILFPSLSFPASSAASLSSPTRATWPLQPSRPSAFRPERWAGVLPSVFLLFLLSNSFTHECPDCGQYYSQ